MELSFGEKIKIARKAQHLTQKQLAEKIGAAHNSISDWENNKNKPDPDTIELLCGVLDLTPNYLLTPTTEDFSPFEKSIIKKYRDLDQHGKEMVDFTLQKEWERSTKIIAFETPALNAASERPDVTSEDEAQTDSVMKTDSEWE